MCLWKLKSLSKITPRLRTLSDGDISLSSNLTGKWLESLFLCCFVPIIINSVLLEFSLSLLPTRIRVQNYSATFISRMRLYVARSPRAMMYVISTILRVCIVTL